MSDELPEPKKQGDGEVRMSSEPSIDHRQPSSHVRGGEKGGTEKRCQVRIS